MVNRFDVGEKLPTLDGGKVKLRWLVEADAPALFEIFGDEEVTRYWGSPRMVTLDGAQALLEYIRQHFRAGTLFQWGIVDANAIGDVIGTCTLADLDSVNRRAALGFALGRKHWGRGFANAAVDAVLRFAFDELKLHRVVADCDPRNARSFAVLERFGFRREGYLREHYFVTGECQDGVLWGLLRTEWSHCVTSRP
jgi:ribosomal-protein-alanine N-acetyltransferase